MNVDLVNVAVIIGHKFYLEQFLEGDYGVMMEGWEPFVV